MPLVGRPIGSTARRLGLEARDWVALPPEQLLYAFTGNARKFLVSRRLDGEPLAADGVYVAFPEGIYRTPHASLSQLLADLHGLVTGGALLVANRGLAVNVRTAEVLRRDQRPWLLGYRVSGAHAVPGGEWVALAERRRRAVALAFGAPVRSSPESAQEGPLAAERGAVRASRALDSEPGAPLDGPPSATETEECADRWVVEEAEMGHVFERPHPGRRWRRVEVPREGLSIRREGDGAVALQPGRERDALAVIVEIEPGGRRAALVSGTTAVLLVNGQPALDVTLLEERDEIAVGGRRLYYGARRALPVGPYAEAPGAAAQERCVRCSRLFESADAVIPCPACSSLHHEGAAASGEQLRCWSHDGRCGACRRLREGLLWSPDPEAEDGVEPAEEPQDG
jgi:hypothetical protein